MGFPNTIPDFTTVWAFRERLSKTATFITSDHGHAKADKPRGDGAKTRRSRDGTWVKKNSKSYFGYKLHSKSDIDFGLVSEIETITASVHDSQVDPTKSGEVAYRDKGYFGAPYNGYSATMRRSVRGHPIGIKDILRNKRISKKGALGEKPYIVLKMCSSVGTPWLQRFQGLLLRWFLHNLGSTYSSS